MKFWTFKWIYNPKKANQQFVFLHIPKTAGTTFRVILYNHFKENDIYPSMKDLKRNGGKYLPQKEIIKDDNILDKILIAGHININILEHLNKNTKTLVFFRNPIDRVFSIIKHIKKYDSELKNQNANEIVSKRFGQIINAQCSSMGFAQKRLNFHVVRENIINLDFIGISEYFEESLQLCNKTFGWKLENIAPLNVLHEDIYSQLTPKTMAKISRALTPEINTYHIAMNQFVKRCRENGINII